MDGRDTMTRDVVHEMTKITLCIDELTTGGAQRVLLFLGRELVKRGHCVDLVVLSDTGALFSQVDGKITVVNLATMSGSKGGPWVALTSLFKLSKYLRKTKPHGVLSTITGSNLLSVVAWFLGGRPGRLVLREATSLKNVSSKWRLFLMSFLYKRADAVIALTSTHANELAQALSLNKSKLTVIGNPIDSEFLEKGLSGADRDFVKSFSPYIVAVGRLTEAKDFSSLIRAYSFLSHLEGFPKLVIVGDGPKRSELERLISDLSLQKAVFLVGHYDSPAGWYANAEGFALTSLWEGYPNALLEALYFHLPVLITRYDKSIDEIISALNLQSFEVAEPANPRDIARALIALWEKTSRNSVSVFSNGVIDAYEAVLLGS